MHRSLLEAKIVIHEGYRIASLTLLGAIGVGGFESSHFYGALQKLGRYDLIFAYLDSPGGAAFDAWIIYDYLKSGPASKYPSLVVVTGQCTGVAILITLGFQQVLMRPNAYMRFEGINLSNTNAARRSTRLMARLIAKQSRCDQKQVVKWIHNQCVLTAKQCLRYHLCDAII
jgi:ATP-dependent protease ClpP protease subunit